MAVAEPKYQKVLLKLSGEALLGNQKYGIDAKVLNAIADEIADLKELEIQISIVIGGGNIFRGVSASANGMDRASADYIGMLATVINALALQDALEKRGLKPESSQRLKCKNYANPIFGDERFGILKKAELLFLLPGPGIRFSLPILPLRCARMKLAPMLF